MRVHLLLNFVLLFSVEAFTNIGLNQSNILRARTRRKDASLFTTSNQYLENLQQRTGKSVFNDSKTIKREPDAHVNGINGKDTLTEKKTSSVLVLSWFHANPRELKLVKLIYRKNGYKDVHIHESPVNLLSKPRGWYRTFVNTAKSTNSDMPELCRHYDIIHCMSGGFLNLYLLLAAGVPLEFDNLVLDSTPILPKPSSFVRFTRAYLEDNGLQLINRLVPKAVHQLAVDARWSVGSVYVRLKHNLLMRKQLKKAGEGVGERADEWAKTVVRSATHHDWEAVKDQAIQTIFQREKPMKCVFLFNPEDKYILQEDIKEVAEKSRGYGNTVTEVHVDTDHVQTIFKKPHTLFEALSEE